MGFEDNPLDDHPDPHGECRHEIHRLQSEVRRLEIENARLRGNANNRVASPEVQRWIETRLRELKDDDVIEQHLPMLKVGHDMGDDVNQIMRCFVASIVMDIAGMPLNPEGN